ncbi:hypothetical protein QTO34_004802 [Cnephaeus nilssonii]|uniref:Uncharacterized protein n=1 Tax=Cnephaeus nilssonii TaxID=3371016 RepID=A0AA40LKS3_CNENI|nr:hypothetical protein QTO34_004802 [Eptesicus nilssonii]
MSQIANSEKSIMLMLGCCLPQIVPHVLATEFTFLSNAKLHSEMAQVEVIRLCCLFKMCLLLEEVSIWQCYFNFMIARYNMKEQQGGRIFYGQPINCCHQFIKTVGKINEFDQESNCSL